MEPVIDDVDAKSSTTTSTEELERAKEIQKLEDELRSKSPRSRSPSPSGSPLDRSRRNSMGDISEEAFFQKEIQRPKKKHYKRNLLFKIFSLHFLLRWPILAGIGTALFVELFAYFMVRLWIWFWEHVIVGTFIALYVPSIRKRNRLFRDLDNAISAEEWKKAAKELDILQNKEAWKLESDDELFDESLIFNLGQQLVQLQKNNDIVMLMKYLQVACKSNLGGISNDILYSRTYYGTKMVVVQYLRQVVKSLRAVGSSQLITPVQKKEFFRTISKVYGRTALCLSGGSTFSFYHLGVVSALRKHRLLPKVISGTSAGSLVAALVCTRTDEELEEVLRSNVCTHFGFNDESLGTVIKRLVEHGSFWDSERWRKKLSKATRGDLTFMEAFKRTGRILNITVIPTDKHAPPILLNYRTAPNVIIHSAVLASAAIPLLVTAAELLQKTETGEIVSYQALGKRWRDGSFKTDIPQRALHQLFNVNYTIVSQTNPHIVPFLFETRGSGGKPSKHRSGSGWRGGFVASSLEQLLKLDMLKWLRLLRNMDLVPSFIGQDSSVLFLQKFHGSCTVFPKPVLSDYFKLIANPDEKEIANKIAAGEKMTWPKLHMIYNRLSIENEARDQLEKWSKLC
eukprot:TRINITY_DN3406_c0_g2_i1.p1 TRINITY_DN3406_c0_g2~~TRINITY_DN3406_c0_g2_i1.p1  ORF type:complete len:626 (+),score=217.71 TRINITY_DN3406_c0_g2_i1:113-1990(+)